jgi:hypothetical protein
MARKNNNTMLLLVGAAAVIAYLYYKKGLTTGTATTPPTTSLPMVPYNPAGIALEQPSPADVNVYTPSLDPTGQSLQLF